MKDLKDYKKNATEEYIATPKSVLRYIIELENASKTEPLPIHSDAKQSQTFYCVSSDALIYGNPCRKWCKDQACKIN